MKKKTNVFKEWIPPILYAPINFIFTCVVCLLYILLPRAVLRKINWLYRIVDEKGIM